MTNVVRRKYRASRRLGVSLWGRAKDAFNVRNYPPGQHGPSGFRKVSDFGKQFAAHKKFKFYYNLSSRQLRNLFLKAAKRRGDRGDTFVGLLESRLVTVLYNSGMVSTIFAARQLISHKHVVVNDRVVNVSSYQVKVGDVMKIKDSAASVPAVLSALQNSERRVPDYVEVNVEHRTIKLLRVPRFSEVLYPATMEVNLVIEFYSR